MPTEPKAEMQRETQSFPVTYEYPLDRFYVRTDGDHRDRGRQLRLDSPGTVFLASPNHCVAIPFDLFAHKWDLFLAELHGELEVRNGKP